MGGDVLSWARKTKKPHGYRAAFDGFCVIHNSQAWFIMHISLDASTHPDKAVVEMSRLK
jgi:hypothetical protein